MIFFKNTARKFFVTGFSLITVLLACSVVKAQSNSASTLDAYEALRTIQPGFAVHTDLRIVPVAKPIQIAPLAGQPQPRQTILKKRYVYNKPEKRARTSVKPATAKSGRQRIDVIIDLSEQSMRVKVGGDTKYKWRVSSGRRGYRTPTGSYKPTRMYRKYFSKKYYNSPMPNSIFFRGGYAIHGTFQTSALGHTASHGCVRLSPKNARRLYDLVEKNGRSRTHIRIKP